MQNLSSASRPPTPDLQANHRKAAIEKNQIELENVYRSIHPLDSNANQGKELEHFEALVHKIQATLDTFRQLSQIRETHPQEILSYIKTLPSDLDHPLNVEEEGLFIEIEEALGDPEIVPAKDFQLNSFQLGILWHAYHTQTLSDRLFNQLIAIRMKKITQIRKSLRFEEREGALYKRPSLEICASIHHELINGDDRKDYRVALETFHQRLRGIKHEQREHSIDTLADPPNPKPKKSVRFQKKDGALNKNSPLESCLSIHKELIDGDDRKDCKVDVETLNQPLQGIKDKQKEYSVDTLADPPNLKRLARTQHNMPSVETLFEPQTQMDSPSSLMIDKIRIESIKSCFPKCFVAKVPFALPSTMTTQPMRVSQVHANGFIE